MSKPELRARAEIQREIDTLRGLVVALEKGDDFNDPLCDACEHLDAELTRLGLREPADQARPGAEVATDLLERLHREGKL